MTAPLLSGRAQPLHVRVELRAELPQLREVALHRPAVATVSICCQGAVACKTMLVHAGHAGPCRPHPSDGRSGGRSTQPLE